MAAQHKAVFVLFHRLSGPVVMMLSEKSILKWMRNTNLAKWQEIIKENTMNTDKTYAERIASEYAPKDTSKVVALKKLDQRAKLPATISAYTIGVIAALLLGAGMCLSMGVIGNGTSLMFGLGVVVGIIGIIGICINYPLYKKLLAKGKEKYAYEIMELAKEISGE